MASAPISSTVRPFVGIRPATPPELPPRPVVPDLQHHKLAPLPSHRPAPSAVSPPTIQPLINDQALILGSGRTISTSVAGPITLRSTDNPLTITATGKVTSTGTGADGVDGPSGTAWRISNAGTVTSSAAYGIRLAGQGTVNNSGLISGRDGLGLDAGGSVTNAAGGSIAASGTVGGGLSVGAGIYITGTTGTVANYGEHQRGRLWGRTGTWRPCDQRQRDFRR